MNGKKSSLYFVAVIPDEEVYQRVHKIKLYFAENYNSKAALKSPPHITLYMPFRWKEEREKDLFAALSDCISSHQSFPVELKDFGAFKPKAIFVDVVENDRLSLLRKDIIRTFKRQLNLFDKGFEERPFRPHMTVAFRDLKKPMFMKAWQEFQKEKYEGQFVAGQVTLLKHNGKSWDRHQQFKLKENN